MIRTTFEQRRRFERLDADALGRYQLERLNRLLQAILPHNAFYAQKLNMVTPEGLHDPAGPLSSLDSFVEFPYTFKDELVSSRHPGDLAANLTFPPEHYTRYHQTSGTRGRPLAVLDTAEDWAWWIDAWQFIFDAAAIGSRDRVLMAFSFGPFVGFWSAFDAACARGCLVVPGGGMTTLARLELARTCRCTTMLCTPSYALHMAEVGAEHQIDVGQLDIRMLILAGEPGGSVPSTRSRIEGAWNARVLDHCGATEVGPWGYGDLDGHGMYVNESDFIAEFLSLETGQAAAEGELAELVLTNLGRTGSPIIRYRTGDLVRPRWQYPGENRFVFLEGGVLGRGDDMMVVRGVNIFPSSIEQILRSFPEIVEFRMTVRRESEMDQLIIEVEDRLNEPDRVATELNLRLGLKVEVKTVALGSLPRIEGKARRFVDQRG
jgi:phenylacetate-CoA ligase